MTAPGSAPFKPGIYASYFKRLLDFVCALLAIIILSPLFLLLIVLGAIKMKGNPFFVQPRPGKNEKIFNMIKFRTMSCEKDDNGNFLPDEVRLNQYGKFLRSTSLDELPELLNIIKGDMSIVGPRPLLVKYLPLYSPRQMHRHDVRPGLTGLAQIHGRNAITWEEKFDWDIKYVDDATLKQDLGIIIQTVIIVLKHEGINSKSSATMEEFKGNCGGSIEKE